jgi:outer membrane protein
MMKQSAIQSSHLCLVVALAVSCSATISGQTTNAVPQLPDAPTGPLMALSQQSATAIAPAPADAPAADQHPRLTRADAEKLAIKNNPRVSAAHLLTLAQHQVVRETRAAELPTLTGNITAVDAENGSRISAGTLTVSRMVEHAGAGGNLSQLITDFGKTRNLVAFSKLQEKAQTASALATNEDIVLVADQAFFNALQSQALLKVADQNVATRQTTETQISELTRNKIKSTLDLSFADVNLSQAKLLQLDAQGNVDSTMAALDAVLGLDHQVTYELVDDNDQLSAPPADADQLLQFALQQRPDLQALDLSHQAAVKFSHAERDQMLPTISAAGTAGGVPVRPGEYYTSSWWGGVGVNMSIPVFNGSLYSAQAKEASIRAQAASEQSRDLRDRIVRDVRTAWLTANTAYQRVSVTAELLNQANLALKLAQTRYKMGLSSIVELSQAQFQQTDAAIGNTDAQYQYRLALATLNYQIGATP